MNWKRTVTAVLVTLAAIVLLVVGLLPALITHAAEKRAPYLDIGSAEIWGVWPLRVYFHDVKVLKPTIKGQLRNVDVLFEGLEPSSVNIHGGHLSVTVDPQAKKGESSSKPPTFSILADLDRVDLTYGKSKGTITAALGSMKDGKVVGCFSKGDFHIDDPRIPSFLHLETVTVGNLCAASESQRVRVGSVEFMSQLPAKLGFDHKLAKVSLTGVQFSKKEEVAVADNLKVSVVGGQEVLSMEGLRVQRLGDDVSGSAAKTSVSLPLLKSEAARFGDTFFWLKGDKLGLIWPAAELVVDLKAKEIRGAGTCSGWVNVLPEPKAKALHAESFDGDLEFSVKLTPSPRISFSHKCSYQCKAEPISYLRVPFYYEAYQSDGTKFQRLTGPESPSWTNFEDIAHVLPDAVISLEDPSFLKHRGILNSSLSVALEQNIDKGYFFRGGSTISQQLAKNLWLSRDKTLIRKAEEIFLTIALEKCLTKAEILELYLNVVEMGPDIYGVARASQYYFQKSPADLSVEEAYYLAGLLPHPKSAAPPNAGGLDQARRLMALLAQNGRIPESLISEPATLNFEGWVPTTP